MGPQTSTNYNVDQRYKGMKNATDDAAGKHFLHQYLAVARGPEKPTLAEERNQDGRIRLYGTGGTVPVDALGLGRQLRNTDSVASVKNPFVKTA